MNDKYVSHIKNEMADLEYINVFDLLKKSNLPILIWGDGDVAHTVNDILLSRSIVTDGFFVDDIYFDKISDNSRVMKWSEVCEKYRKVNVVVGHSNYELYTKIKDRDNVETIYMLAGVHFSNGETTPAEEILDNIWSYEKVFSVLADDCSRKCFDALIMTHVSGNARYALDAFEKEMNFFDNDIFRVDDKEVFVDAGAYNGDTLRLFLQNANHEFKKIYCIEPDDKARCELELFANTVSGDVEILDKALWNCKETLEFSSDGQLSGIGRGNLIEADELDSIIPENINVTLIKINYWIGVREALQGANRILKNNAPKLAISVGFDCKGILGIVDAIINSNPEYKLYLRMNRGYVGTMTLYGVI